MLMLLLLIQFAYAEEPSVIQVMDPMPIISVDDGRKNPTSESIEIPSVDTEGSSPLAPQTFDGFGGVVQEPFSPTEREQEEMREKQAAEVKRLAEARMAQEQKSAAAMIKTLPAKSAGGTKIGATKPAPKVVSVNMGSARKKPGARVQNKPKMTQKRLPAAVANKAKRPPPTAKPGALKVAPKQIKK